MHHRRDLERLRHDVEVAGIDLRHVEQRVHHGEEMQAGGVDDLGVFAPPLGRSLERTGRGEHLGEADDGVERRAQLVADGREETRLRLVRRFGVAAGALELLRPALVVGDVAGHRDDGVRARGTRLGVDAVGAGLDPDHPGGVPVLAPLGRFEMEPEFERDRLGPRGPRR